MWSIQTFPVFWTVMMTWRTRWSDRYARMTTRAAARYPTRNPSSCVQKNKKIFMTVVSVSLTPSVYTWDKRRIVHESGSNVCTSVCVYTSYIGTTLCLYMSAQIICEHVFVGSSEGEEDVICEKVGQDYSFLGIYFQIVHYGGGGEVKE